jgi:hypothetical protein
MPDVSKIKNDGSMQFKKDKYKIGWIEYIVEGEWLNGVPHGVCIVESKGYRGVATFTHGIIEHGGPGWWEDKDDGTRWSYEYYDNGEGKGVYRVYYSDT